MSTASLQTPRGPAAPTVAVWIVGSFCGTAATVGINDAAQIVAPLWEVQAGNPILFVLGFVFGVVLVRRRFEGRPVSPWPWLIAWAGLVEVASLVALFGKNRTSEGLGALLTGGLAVVAFVLSVPVGLAFGFALMRLGQALGERLHRAWFASGDPARVAGAGAGWLLAAGAVKWVTQPVSFNGLSAVLAAAVAVWLAARSRRWGLMAAASALAALALTVKSCSLEQDLAFAAYQKKFAALPECADAMKRAAAQVPGVARVTVGDEGGGAEVQIVPARGAGDPTTLRDSVDAALRRVACKDNDPKYGQPLVYKLTVAPAD